MKKITPLRVSALSTLALAISANVSMTAHATETLETMIVTASKIETDIQQTAVSMQSISAEALTKAGVESLADIAKFTPGLELTQTGGGLTATVRIRGIGTPANSALDPSVPLFIDGVAQGRTGAGFQDLVDVARVEVLRGPQGTLYGRNSTAGAISVWTKDANTHDWGGTIQAQVGDYNDRELKGTVNVPLVDGKLAARISGFTVRQDGYIDNKMDNKTYNGYADRQGARGKFLWTPTENISVQWISDYSDAINHPVSMISTYPAKMNTYAAGGIATNPNLSGANLQSNGLPIPDPFSDKTYFDHPSSSEDINIAHSVTVNWDIQDGFLADHTLTSITAYQNYRDEQDLEKEYTPLNWAVTNGTAKTKSGSQELRISSDALEHWEYVAGLFYYKEDLDSLQHTDNIFPDQVAATNRGIFGAFPNNRTSNSESHSLLHTTNGAIFGQATYAFTDAFSLTAGLRESKVTKWGYSDVHTVLHFGAPQNSTSVRPVQVLINDESQTENDLSGVVKARYFIDADKMLYASFDRGFKPGGFNRLLNANSGAATTFQKENSNNFEIGLKSRWLDNTLQANIALFYMDFLNYHNQVNDPVTSNIIVENVKSVSSEGIEIDLQALLTTDLTAGLSASYLNPRVADDKVGSDQSSASAPRPGHSRTLENGELINDVSQYSANLFAEYSYPLAGTKAMGFIRADLAYHSTYLLQGQGLNGAGGTLYQGGYSTSNLRFGVRNFDEHWTLTGWVKNLTDKDYAQTGSFGIGNQTDGTSIVPGAPRTIGATVQYDY